MKKRPLRITGAAKSSKEGIALSRSKQSEAFKAKTQVEDYREKMRVVLAGIILVSIYTTGFLEAVLSGEEGSFSLKAVFSSFFSSGATFILLPSLIFLLTGIALFMVQKAWEEGQREDKLDRGFLHSKGSSPYGDAHFEEPWEFVDAAQIRPASECKGKILGQLGEDGSKCIDFNPYEGRINSHMVAIGRSGGGKTFTFVKSFLMQAMKERHSLFVADPKGDLYRETSSYFRDNGYVVRKLDLKNLEKTDGWHCLGSLHGANLITNTQIFSSTVMANISERDDVYSRAGGSLLSALILRVLQGREYPPEKKNIKTVHELLQNPGGIDFLDTLLSSEHLTSSEEACTRFYMDFKRASGNLAGNILTHLSTGIQLLNNPLLGDILSTDDIDLTLAGQVPCIYYINFPDTDVTFKFIISLFFSMAFINLVDYADIHTKNGKLPVPVDFLLDEFPALGVIPDWDRKIATVRSRQINCVMIIQDVPQLKKRYLESWMTILNNCGCLLTLGINEPAETAPYLSRRIGETSIEVVSKSESRFAGRPDPFVSKQSTGVGKREFLSVAEICELSRDGSLILFADHQPVYANKFPYILHPDAEKMEDTLPGDVIDFSDREGRKRLREIESAYRERFWKEHVMYPDMKYGDLSDALLADKPQAPVSMLAAMLRDDWRAIKKALAGRLKPIRVNRKSSETGDYNTETSGDHSAEKGAFRRFYEEYNKQAGCLRYRDLGREDSDMSGKTVFIDDGSVSSFPGRGKNEPTKASRKEPEKGPFIDPMFPPVENTTDKDKKNSEKKGLRKDPFQSEGRLDAQRNGQGRSGIVPPDNSRHP